MKMRIDPHVHCRGGNQSYKTTIAQVLQAAKLQGVDIIFDMPNTNPPILTSNDVANRLLLVSPSEQERYYLYVGLTADQNQVRGAVDCWNNFKKVIGLKMFAGHSVGSLAVIEDEDQQHVYNILAKSRYRGVLAIHCERELNLKPDLWDPSQPASHSLARPKEAEVNSVRNQIRFAMEAGFKGVLHICHVSCPETVEVIEQARKNFGDRIKITCGVTPHHLMLSIEDQIALDAIGMGNLLKVNPPLRGQDDRAVLIQNLVDGDIDWIETDHAPHSMDEKFAPPYMSGIPSLFFYKKLLDMLSINIGMDESFIETITFDNIVKAFSPKFDHLLIK